MGREIETLAKSRGHEIAGIVDNQEALAQIDPRGIEVAIEVTVPTAVMGNLQVLAKKGINTVVGTTGWYEQLPEVEALVRQSDIGLLWSSNFSIGVNLYFRMVEAAAKLINKAEAYDVWATEIHHKNKADSPSGTAKTLESILLSQIDRKTKVIEEKLERRIEPHEIHFSSTRGGVVNFAHTIGFDSEADCIKLEHSARNRGGYVLGAVQCAEWLVGKKGCYEMDDFLKDLLGESSSNAT